MQEESALGLGSGRDSGAPVLRIKTRASFAAVPRFRNLMLSMILVAVESIKLVSQGTTEYQAWSLGVYP